MTRSTRLGWLLDERASAGRENLDAGHVSRYDAKEDSDVLREVRLLQGLGLDSASAVVDLGAGTGQFALAVAPVCSRVIVIDVSPVMHAGGSWGAPESAVQVDSWLSDMRR